MILEKKNSNFLWAQFIIEALKKCGVKKFFTSPGHRNVPLLLALSKSCDVDDVITSFDERSLAYMGLGYAKATNEKTVIICTSGTSLGNLYPAVLEAYYDNIPLLVVTADRPEDLYDCGANQSFDQRGFFKNHTVKSLAYPAPCNQTEFSRVARQIEECVKAPELSGPIHINLSFRDPLHIYEEDLPCHFSNGIMEALEWCGKNNYRKEQVFPHQIRNIESALVIMATKNEDVEFSRFCRENSIPIVRETKGKGAENAHKDFVFDFDHPADCEFFLNETISHLFIFGERFISKNIWKTLQKKVKKDQIKVFLIGAPYGVYDFDPIPHERLTLAPRLVLLENSTQRTFYDHFACYLKRKKEIWKEVLLQRKESSHLLFIEKMNTVFQKSDSLFFLGNGLIPRAWESFGADPSHKAYFSRALSGIDGLISQAVGLAYGLKREVYLVIGDLSFLYDLNALMLVKNCPYPIKIVVVNNDGGGIFQRVPVSKEALLRKDLLFTPHNTSISRWGNSIGITCFECRDCDNLEDSLKKLKESTESCLLEFFMDKEYDSRTWDIYRTHK